MGRHNQLTRQQAVKHNERLILTRGRGGVSVDVINGTLLTRVHGISLIQAARDGLLDVVKANLDSCHTQINEVDEDGYSALHYAARYNRIKVAELLVESGADIGIKQGQDEVTPLHLAGRYNSGTTTQFLLARGASVNATDAKGKTPLHYATRRGNDLVIKMLLSVTSCNVNAADNDQTTPLIMAAMYGNAIICESLVSRGADIERRDINQMTPLMWASAEGHSQVVKVLLNAARRRGVENQQNYIKAYDKDGSTALHLAVQNGSLEVVNILLGHEADVNCVKNNLYAPLHLAATYGFLEIAKVLVYAGAEINSRDLEQATPIHQAALFNMVDILDFLYKRGGNISARDKKNVLPLHFACWKGQTEAVEYLLSHGAQIAECDSSLRTALHWAVQYGHLDTLRVLIQYGGRSAVGNTDKNDQTVLHYAANSGNVQVLKILLEIGARPGAKDQEERSALHIAAQNDSVSCVEALIQASNHETNDNDVDGRTPLLLACLQGHQQVVQVLLQLGGDISKRDDEHRTALMLAAAEGHTLVMKTLLDNHASINDGDKMKNTALHYACYGGHVEAVQLLLEKKADVTLKNTYNQSPLDQAIDNLHSDVVFIMLRNKSTCQACMSVRNGDGKTVLDRLIAKLPDAAMIVLDHCVDRTVRDDEERCLTMTLDYQYIDPGPDDPGCVINRYFALNSMILHGRDTLLSHPVCQNILSQKWFRYGQFLFTINLLTYLGYLTCLTSFVIIESPDMLDSKGCPIMLTPEEKENNETKFQLRRDGQVQPDTPYEPGLVTVVFGDLLYVFVALFIARDVLKAFSQKWKYLFSFYNFMVWVLMITTLLFIYPTGHVRCLTQWKCGWIAMFLAWINFIMYLRRIDMLGMYVIMFVTILSSLLKVVLVFVMFGFAFAISFYILMPYDIKMFHKGAVVNLVVMTLGEFQFNDKIIMHEPSLAPFDMDARVLLAVFLFVMPIVCINLTIGVAIGDIDKIERNAYLQRTGLQVDLMYDIENNMPKFLQRRVHVKRAVIKPNEAKTCIQKVALFMYCRTRNTQFIHTTATAQDKRMSRIEVLTDKMRSQQTRFKTIQLALQQRLSVLQHIACKLNIPMLEATPAPRRSSLNAGNDDVFHPTENVRNELDTDFVVQHQFHRRGATRRERLKSTVV